MGVNYIKNGKIIADVAKNCVSVISFFVAQVAETEFAMEFVFTLFVQKLVLAGVVIYMIFFYLRYLTPQKNNK